MLKLLEKLYKMNLKSASIYNIAAENEKHLLQSNFYSRLRSQKLANARELEVKIEGLRKEFLCGKASSSLWARPDSSYTPSLLRIKSSKYFNQAYTRELKAFYFYKKYLSRINRGDLREMMMNHLHQIKLNIGDMNFKGARKYNI